jgi:hypothetical protein
MKTPIILSVASAIFAAIAAGLWFVSAVVKTPDSFSIHVVRPNSGPLGEPLDGTYVGQAHSNDLIELANALRRQSRFSAWAATAAGISALAQTAALVCQACD